MPGSVPLLGAPADRRPMNRVRETHALHYTASGAGGKPCAGSETLLWANRVTDWGLERLRPQPPIQRPLRYNPHFRQNSLPSGPIRVKVLGRPGLTSRPRQTTKECKPRRAATDRSTPPDLISDFRRPTLLQGMCRIWKNSSAAVPSKSPSSAI